MINAVIQNSFVSGELSPELYARHDMRQYFQGARKIRNFIPRRSGGVRKRSGTQLVAALRDSATAWRVIPYVFDRQRYGILYLFLAGSSQLRFRFSKSGGAFSESASTGLSGFSAADLASMNYKQIGDTIYLTLSGRRSFKAVVTFDSGVVEFNDVPMKIDVAAPPTLGVSVTGMFTPGDSYKATTRKYAIWGVKDGVFSTPSEKEANIVLPWQAGAKVTLSFTPRWDRHDYYVMGKMLGADYAALATFYPDSQLGNRADATWTNPASPIATATIDDTEYAASTTTIASAWKNSPDDIDSATGKHVNAALVDGTVAFTMNSASPILALRIHFGGKLAPSDGGSAVAVGAAGVTTVTLKNDLGAEIASWTVSSAYTESDVLLSVVNPALSESKVYSLEFDNEHDVPVVVRGIVPVTDSATQTYTDTNIEPVQITGLQEHLTVGDTGMDCALCEVWQQRLVFAASQGNPFTLWFSAVGNILGFHAMRPQTMQDGFSISIPPVAATRILHMYSGQWLMLFTEAGEYLCSSGEQAFGFATASIHKISSVVASESVRPIDTASTLLFAGADNRSVFSMRYDLAQDNVIPIDLSIFTRHLTENRTIVRMAYQRYPDSVAWCLLDDGTLLSITWQPDQEVLAWARHDFGGDGGLVLKDIVSYATVREVADCDTISEMLLVWEHPAEPGTVWIERMRAQTCVDAPTVATALCVDHSGYAEADYPNGNPVEALVDAELVTLRPESQNFNTMGLAKTILGCTVRFRRSGKFSIRPLRGGLGEVNGGGVTIEDTRVSLVTDDVNILPRSFYNGGGEMVVRSADAYPCEIQSIRFNVRYDDINAGEGGG